MECDPGSDLEGPAIKEKLQASPSWCPEVRPARILAAPLPHVKAINTHPGPPQARSAGAPDPRRPDRQARRIGRRAGSAAAPDRRARWIGGRAGCLAVPRGICSHGPSEFVRIGENVGPDGEGPMRTGNLKRTWPFFGHKPATTPAPPLGSSLLLPERRGRATFAGVGAPSRLNRVRAVTGRRSPQFAAPASLVSRLVGRSTVRQSPREHGRLSGIRAVSSGSGH